MNERNILETTTDNPQTELRDVLLQFFKALSDSNRLKIVGLLANQPLSVEQLAEILNLRPSTVSHHLAQLSKAELVSAHTESYYNIYSLETGTIKKIAKDLLQEETLPSVATDIDLGAYDRKVIKDFTYPDGRLKAFPAQRKKMEAVLRYVLQSFEIGEKYSEKEVNQILKRFHEDSASLRRELVEYRWLKREGGGGLYWREEE